MSPASFASPTSSRSTSSTSHTSSVHYSNFILITYITYVSCHTGVVTHELQRPRYTRVIYIIIQQLLHRSWFTQGFWYRSFSTAVTFLVIYLYLNSFNALTSAVSIFSLLTARQPGRGFRNVTLYEIVSVGRPDMVKCIFFCAGKKTIRGDRACRTPKHMLKCDFTCSWATFCSDPGAQTCAEMRILFVLGQLRKSYGGLTNVR